MTCPGPALSLETHLEEWGLRAWLVVDRHVRGVAWGGLRILPDPSAGEVRAAARAMTLKYGFVGFASGGAKAALELPAALQSERGAILRELGRRWREVLRTRAWNPAIDMGCTPADLDALHAGAGTPGRLLPYTLRSGDYTAWSVFASAEAAFRSRGEELRGRSCAIQGLGSVGTELARMLHEADNRVVAVSNRNGALWCPGGIDVPDLLRRRARLGDAAIPPGESTAPDFATLDVDLFVPCARWQSVREDMVAAVRARVIACGANAAISGEVEASLHAAGVRVVPDFVANCGGILGSTLEPYLGDAGIRDLLRGAYARKVEKICREADLGGEPVGAIAARQSLRTLGALDHRGRGGLFSFGRDLLRRLPGPLRIRLARAWCERWLFRG